MVSDLCTGSELKPVVSASEIDVFVRKKRIKREQKTESSHVDEVSVNALLKYLFFCYFSLMTKTKSFSVFATKGFVHKLKKRENVG